MALPKFLYVYEDSAKDEQHQRFFVASRETHEQMEGIIGVYDLREILHIRHQPQFRKPGTKLWFNKASK